MADNKQINRTNPRRPDCVTEIRMGNSVLVVSGFFKQGSSETAADKWQKYCRPKLLHKNRQYDGT